MADRLDLNSNLLADIHVAADVVGRELAGFIPAVSMNSASTQASKGDFVRAAFTRSASADDATEHMTIPEANTATVDEKNLQLSKHRVVRHQIGGEDTRTLQNTGSYASVYGDLVEQSMRTLVNEMEADIATEIKTSASRATEDGGATIFANNDFDSIGEARKILVDNGAPATDLQLVMDTRAGANLRGNTNLVQANTSGSTLVREQGILLPVFGMDCRESAQILPHTKGTGTAYDIVSAGEAIGQTTLTLEGGTNGGTGIVAGDVIAFDTDTANQYVVNTGLAGDSGNIIINSPGLKVAGVNASELSIKTAATQAYAFHRRAVELAMRAPADPVGGDAAFDVATVTDDRTGLVFQIRIYKGYHANMIEVGVVYGVKAWKSDFIATIYNDA